MRPLARTLFASTCRTRAFVELARAKPLSTTSWKHDALPIGQCECQNYQLSNLPMPIDDCQCDRDVAVHELKNECDPDELTKKQKQILPS